MASSQAHEGKDGGRRNAQRQGSAARNSSTMAASASTSSSSTKSWITRGLGTMMQLPKKTPLAALYWTTPEGPMPQIVYLPSRDGASRMIEVYIWVPPVATTTATDGDSAPSFSSSSRTTQAKAAMPAMARRLSGKTHTLNSNGPATTTSSFSGDKRPCLVDFHGGGFVMGGPLEQAPWCAALARSGIIAISVAYRLGPTWEFPAALHDAEDVIRAVLDDKGATDAGRLLRQHIATSSGDRALQIDTSRVALSGFSSGGNVALNMLLDLPGRMVNGSDGDAQGQAADWPSPFTRQRNYDIPALLFFPSLDARKAVYERTRPPGMAPPGEFSKFIGRSLRNAYLPAHMVGHLRASPGLAPLGSSQEPTGTASGAARADEARSDRERKEAALQAAQRAQADAKKSSHEAMPASLDTHVPLHASYDAMLPATRALLILPEIDTLAEQSEVWVRALDASGKLQEGVTIDGTVFGEEELAGKSRKSSKDPTEAEAQAKVEAERRQQRSVLQGEERDNAASLATPLLHTSGGAVRVHRIRGMSHGFTTFPDSFLDVRTRAVKAIVMEQARRWVIGMLGGAV